MKSKAKAGTHARARTGTRAREELSIESIAIDALRLNEQNPRKLTEQQERNLTESLRRFGIVDPIIVNRNAARRNVVIGGHQRLKAARALNMTRVPVLFLDLDEEKERELNLRLNQNVGEWDWDLLRAFDQEMLLAIGFAESELRKLFNNGAPADPDSLQFHHVYEVVVTCTDEDEQRRVYDSLTEQGMKCRTLTL